MATKTYGIDKYIYLCYNYFQQDTALERPFDSNYTSAKGYIDKVIAEQEAAFKNSVGLSVDEFMALMKSQTQELKDFNLLFNGLSAGGVNFSGNVTSDEYDQKLSSAANSVVTFAMGNIDKNKENVADFIKKLGKYNALDFGLLEILNKGSGESGSIQNVTATLNLLFNNNMKVSIDVNNKNVQAYFFEEMLEQFEKVLSEDLLVEGKNAAALDFLKKRYNFKYTTFSKDGSKLQDYLKTIDDVLTHFKQYQSGESNKRKAITQEGVKNLIGALKGIRRIMGVNEEVLTSLRAEGLARAIESKIEDYGDTAALSLAESAIPKNVGRSKSGRMLDISVKFMDSDIKKKSRNSTAIFQDRTYNKTADVTLTFPGGTTPVSISTKRYNITRAWSITVSSRNYLQTLAFLRSGGDTTIESYGTSQAMLNAFYFGYGRLSYLPNFKTGKLEQTPKNLTRGTIDADHLKVISNFNIRMLVDFLSVNKQAFFDINGFFIPAPLYLKYALEKTLKEEYQDGTNLSSLNSVMIEMEGFSNAIQRILNTAPISEIEHGAIPWNEFVQPRAYMRNMYTRNLIFSSRVRIQPRMLTFETYRQALDNAK